MLMIKSLLLAGFILISAFANGGNAASRPAIATLDVQSNFDFSLTRREFRVHYSGLGQEFTPSPSESVSINIYESGSQDPFHSFTVSNTEEKKVYQLAVNKAVGGKYEVEVCSGTVCSEKNPALTEVHPVDNTKITCDRVDRDGKILQNSDKKVDLPLIGAVESDLITPAQLRQIQSTIAAKVPNYATDFSKHDLSENPTYKHDGNIFYAAVFFDIARYKGLFDKKTEKDTGNDFAHEFCERKYLLSAHAHIVDQTTKEVKHRFKTTLFLSEGGKKTYVLSASPSRVHVEMTHKGQEIKAGTYDLWITFCATEKDAIESTFCADPLVKENFEVKN